MHDVDPRLYTTVMFLAGAWISWRVAPVVVEARSSLRDRLRGEGVDAKLSDINRFTSVADAVDSFQRTGE